MFDIRHPTWRQSIALAMLIVVGLMLSGWLLADRLMPPAVGAPSQALPLQNDATPIDRELAPLLAAHPGQSGVILLPDGLDAYAARVMSARQAGRSLDVMYYIWHDDITGRLLAHALWEAAERGVRVRLLLDDMNAVDKDVKWLALDSHPNIELRVYNPFRNRQGLDRVIELVQRVFTLNHRMHNKVWIADGRAAVVGGRNVGVEYFEASHQSNFRDLDALVFGPVVADASRMFDAYWNSEAVVPIAALRRKPQARLEAFLREAGTELQSARALAYQQRVAGRKALHDYAERRLSPHWTAQARIVADPPIKRDRTPHSDWLVDRIRTHLQTTRREALLVSPYFVPGDAFTAALVQRVRDGQHIGIITNSLAANDVFAVHGGYAKYRPRLLRGGVELFELRAEPGMQATSAFGSAGASLHTKAYVLDGERGFIGSYNLDPRSAYLNTEMGLMFDDAGIATALREEYRRLSKPGTSYRVVLSPEGEVRWQDRSTQPPTVLTREPDTTWQQRALARITDWLPIESQL